MRVLRRLYIAIFIGLLFCYGCGGRWAGGTMRIDVEVYKGPLSQEPETQWGELVGYLEETKRGMVEVTNFILAAVQTQNFESLKADHASNHSMPIDVRRILGEQTDPSKCDKYCAPPHYLNVPNSMGELTRDTATKVTWCDGLEAHGWLAERKYVNCVLLRGVYTDAVELIREASDALHQYGHILHEDMPDPTRAEAALREIAEMSSEFRGKAFRWAVGTTAGQSSAIEIRIAIVNFIVAASEYGNQLQARADSLMKQHTSYGRDHHELPLSVYLRDSEPTDFVHLYDWLNASVSGWFSNNIAERINVVERLFANHFWARINTVYASGAGKVRMAFVKDAIGNWDLKDFDNAPAELLQTYGEVARELANRALDLAKRAMAPGAADAISSIQLLLNGAKQALVTTPQSGRSDEAAPLESARELTAGRLTMLLKSREDEDKALSDNERLALQKLNSVEESKRTGSQEEKAWLESKQQLKAYREETLIQMTSIIKDYGRLLHDFESHTKMVAQ